MFRFLISFFVLVAFQQAFAQSTVKIEGFAPDYVGKAIEIYQIEDYFSLKESRMASGTVKEDSTFSITFFADRTQRVVVRGGNNRSYMYIQPNGKYDIYFPEKDEYMPYRPAGNLVELTFYGLDTNDINYRILEFNRWTDNFIASQSKRRIVDAVEYNKKMDDFKETVFKFYAADTGSYLYDYVRYSLASLDNIAQAADRNRYEKHDFYLKHYPVRYDNDAYMDYFTHFYHGMIPALSMEANNRVYLGVLKSSPTMVMKALGLEYTLINMRIREMVMIQSLSEAYYSPDFPQTNIITILDSVANHAMFDANKLIAANMIERLTEVSNGGKAPDFALKNNEGELKSLSDFKGKHLYIHFFNPASEKSTIELPLLIEIYGRYLQDVQFITVCPEKYITDGSAEVLDQIPWTVFIAPDNHQIWKHYKVQTFPNYVLIDPFAYVVAAPALGPQPNGEYETIDQIFFSIQKMNKQMRGE